MLMRIGVKNTHPSLVRVQTCTTTVEISVAVLQEDGNISASRTWYPTYPKDLISCYRDICSSLLIAALFMIARNWKQPRSPSSDEWLEKIWCIHTTKCYSAVNKNEIMKSTGKWVEIEKSSSERQPRPRKTKIVCFLLYVGVSLSIRVLESE